MASGAFFTPVKWSRLPFKSAFKDMNQREEGLLRTVKSVIVKWAWVLMRENEREGK